MDTILPSQGDNIIRTRDVDVPLDQHGLAHFLFNAIQQHKSKIAQINAETGSYDTHEDLLQKSVRVACEMKLRGIKPDDMVCLCSENQTDVYVAYFAAILVGAVMSALDPNICKTDMEHLLAQVCPRMVFVTPSCEILMEEMITSINIISQIVVFGQTDRNIPFDNFLVSRDTKSEEAFQPHKVDGLFKTAIIIFSSGTTGLPKSICLNHYALMRNVLNLRPLFGSTEVVMGFSSAYWITSNLLLLSTILYGKTRILIPQFNIKNLWCHIANYKVNFISCATFQAASLLKAVIPEGLNMSNLKVMVISGSKITAELLEAMRSKLPDTTIVPTYGLTETSGLTLQHDSDSIKKKPPSCGKPIPGFYYKVVDPETEEILGPNKLGELRLKCKLQMNGYHNIDSSSAWDSNGWLRTGDIYYYDEDYCFYFVDRLKAVIKYRGIHVQCTVLEDIILDHPAVDQAAVIGLPHPDDEEHPMAVIVLKENSAKITTEELKRYVDERVDDPKKLRGGVWIVNELPMTPTAKINVRELKRQICKELNIVL